ncbi:hypothetical protein CPC08DRAFT_730685 [Agrocybe pediades]|nr:hypothetical protein CPC08DRAFT_730685 [Agrocybe pediades]
MRAAESLVADTLEIVQDIEKFYIARGDVLDTLPDVRDAIRRLSKCLPILQLANSPERGLRRTLFKIELWRSRKVESDIRNLREQANKCYCRFTRHAQLGTAVAIGELKGTVSEGFSVTTRQLSALQVSNENVLAFMCSTSAAVSTLPPGVVLSEDLVFKLYVRSHVGKIDNILKNLAFKQFYSVDEPDDHHARPFTTETSFLLRTPGAIEYVRGNTVAELIRVQHRLGKLVEIPTGDLAQATAMRTECSSLLKTCAPSFATDALTAHVLSQSAHYRRAMGEHSSASIKDLKDSVALLERLGADQMAVVGPQQGGNYAPFSLQLRGGDKAVLDYAKTLDLQRVFLYASERYREALDVGEKALRLFSDLAECYKHVEIQCRGANLRLFLCRDVFCKVIPLSSALKHAQEAVRIWEEVQGPTSAEEERAVDCLAMQTKILIEMGRPSDALAVFQKLARRVRTMATNQRMYIHKMQDLASSLSSKKHYAEAATASRTVVEICRQTTDSVSTSQRFLINTLLDHIKHCDDANYLSEALVYSQDALAIAGQERLKDASFVNQYLLCVDWAGYLSLEAGYPEQAINQCQVALNVDSSSFGYYNGMLWVIATKALAFLRLGHPSLAAATITEGYDYLESTTSTLNLQKEGYYGRLLHVFALVHRCRGKQDDALMAIKAAISIFEFCGWNQRLHTLSDVQADMGYDAEALRTAEEAVKSTRRRAYRAYVSYILNHKYKTSQYSLCLRLFFNGEFTRARQLILEVRAFYEWHAHSRNAWFIDLARALRAEGILECASDRHVEGAAARTRLNELQQRLRATFPGLAHQVDVDLNYERNYPAWKRLREKYPLTCSHWIEDVATQL